MSSILLCALVFAGVCAPASAALSTSFDADVIVIGGGISGLFAAHELQSSSNLSILVRIPSPSSHMLKEFADFHS
jgi:heterodisulfide reductase subunit A-like polyferredoxin